MTKARSLADFISDGSPLADGTISVSEVSGAAPLANPSFTGNVSVTGNVDGVDIATRDAVLTSTTTTANAALPKAGGAVTGNVTFGDNDKAIFGASSDLQIYHDGTNSYIKDAGTGDLFIQATDQIKFKKADGSEYHAIFADGGSVDLYYAGVEKFKTTSTGIQVTGSIANASGDLTIDAASYLMLDADGGNIVLQDNADTFGRFVSTNDDFIIQSDSTDKDIIFKGNDGGSTITALTLDMSASGDAIFNSDVVMGSTGKLRSNGDDDSYLQFNQANVLRAVIGDSTRMIISTGETVFNEDSGDFDFRVESNGQSSMLFVDGGNDRVGVGTSSPSTDFEVRKGVTSAIRVSGGSNTNYKTEIGYDNSTGPYIKAGSSGIQSLQFYVDNTSLALTLASNDVATFTSDVNATNFNSTSDATLKTNVETLTGSLDAVKSLRGVSFDWIENGGSEIGVIAQEVEDVLPDVVNTNEDGIKSVKYGNIVAVLIEAMKEQQAQIDELKTQINS